MLPTTGTLATLAGVEAFTNKTLGTSKILTSTVIESTTGTARQIGFDASGATDSTKTTLVTVQTANRSITYPDQTTTLVGRDTTDQGAGRLKNKQLDQSSNFTDTADTTKNLVIDTSAAATATTTTLKPASTVSRTINLPDASTDLLGDDAQATVTNKDIDGGTASDIHRITVPSDTLANLLALTRKAGTIVYATDSQAFLVDNGTTLVSPGSGITQEFASNSSGTDANDTTSFVSGSGGAAGIIGVASLSAARLKRVQFSTASTAGNTQDILEVLDNGVWSPMHQVVPVTNAGLDVSYGNAKQFGTNGTQTYGVGLMAVSSTEYDVLFGRFCVVEDAGAGTGGEWNQITSSTAWRVRRITYL